MILRGILRGSLRGSLLLSLLIGASQSAICLPAGPQDPPAAEDQEDGPKRLTEWPKIIKGTKVKVDIARLRKANTEEMGAGAHAKLVEAGPGVAPQLIEILASKTLANPKYDDTAARFIAVLDELTDASHTRLIEPGMLSKSPRLQSWALQRVALFPDPGTKETAEQALAKLRKAKLKDERFLSLPFHSALACAAAGSTAGLDVIYERVDKTWRDVSRQVRSALDGVRGDAATEFALAKLAIDDRAKKVAALRMLAGCGSNMALAKLREPLDSSDNSIRVSAINACRGIVDGALPLEKLSAFTAVEKAQSWLQKLGR
jgi:hypothetical protein